MTTLIKTQCPSCQVHFDLNAELPELLHRPNTQMCCAHCQHLFLVNEHLVVSTHDDLSANSAKADDQKLVEDSSSSANSQPSDNAWLEELLSRHHEQNHPFSQVETDDKAFEQEPKEPSTPALLTKPPLSSSKADRILSEENLSQFSSSRRMANNQQRRLSHYEDGPQSVALLLWIAGCLVLILSLFAQYIVFNLNTLIKNPDYAARLETVCLIAACSLPSADLEAFVISDLQFRASKVKAADTFSDIQATLSNQSTQTQLLPSLKVSIYDSEALIGEFIAMPEDYLIARQSQLSAGYSQAFMFTTPLSSQQISKITIEAIY